MLDTVRAMGELGVTDIMHTPRDSDATPELIAFAKSRGLTFTPTLANTEPWHFAENPKLLEDPMLQGAFYPKGWARITDTDLRAKLLADPSLPQRKESFKKSLRFIKAMSDAGVRVATGTDTGAELSPVPFGSATHREIEIFVEAGLTPLAAPFTKETLPGPPVTQPVMLVEPLGSAWPVEIAGASKLPF